MSYLDDNKLPNDMLRYLLRNYLKESDSLALVLSGAYEKFNKMFWHRRSALTFTDCHYLRSDTLSRFAAHNPSFKSTNITTLNLSHLHWIPAVELSCFIKQMPNLQELNIEDTKITLTNLLDIFNSCKKTIKLSFTLNEKNMDQFQDGASLDLLKEGFGRLTHLRVITFAQMMNTQAVQSWIVILGVLSWCKDCVDLIIDITYSDNITTDHSSNLISQRITHFKRITALLSSLGWMKSSLKSLVILKNGSSDNLSDYLPYKLLLWLLSNPEQVLDPAHVSLERLWIDGAVNHEFDAQAAFSFLPLLTLKSYSLFGSKGRIYAFDENAARFHHLEHLGKTVFRLQCQQLSNLKFAKCRYLLSPHQGFNEFCAAHSLLEVLLFEPNRPNRLKCMCPFHKKKDLNWSPNWSLMNLKILGNRCIVPCPRFMNYVSVACPNIEELHIGVKNGEWRYSLFSQARDFFSGINFKHLRVLTINGMNLFNGSYLPLIFENCPKLERFHLGGRTCDITLLSHVAECLTNNLRDFRLQIENDIDDMTKVEAEVLTFLKAVRERSPRLKRLVLYNDKNDRPCDPRLIQELQDYIVTFVKKMPELVALCLSGFQFNQRAIESIKRQLIEQVLPDRPAFWLHLDWHHPRESDTSVPQIHNAEIINPIDWFDVPPKF